LENDDEEGRKEEEIFEPCGVAFDNKSTKGEIAYIIRRSLP
jgi:hypothetical protein